MIFVSCSDEKSTPREIRGHEQIYDGVAHGLMANRGERYCQLCHGVKLIGGTNLEPSCYQCHGKLWIDDDPEFSIAPTDHTVLSGKWNHHPNLLNPVGTCDQCHGTDLKGNVTDQRSSCYLCHDQKW